MESTVISSYYGTVIKVFRHPTAPVQEDAPLFLIETERGIEQIVSDGTGTICSYEVGVGDEVVPGMVLAYIEEDLSLVE